MIHIDIYELYTLIVLDWIESDEYFYTLVWIEACLQALKQVSSQPSRYAKVTTNKTSHLHSLLSCTQLHI